jgi:GNAT superfamily N-acetyltransferase
VEDRYRFVPYAPARRDACLGLFDANCPSFFAPNERDDYAAFLDGVGSAYTLCLEGDHVVAAFGVLEGQEPARARLNWIIVDPAAKGGGIGRAIMGETARRAQAAGRLTVDIAASHHSAPFFSRFGARQVTHTPDGWGPDMHRVDMEWPLVRQG